MVAKTLMQFFFDGYDTLGSALSMAFYFLAINPDVQEKAIEEVDQIAAKCGDAIRVDDINELKYMDQIFSETGRMAPVAWTYRSCTKEWSLPDHPGVVIPIGMRVMIPIIGLQVIFEYKIQLIMIIAKLLFFLDFSTVLITSQILSSLILTGSVQKTSQK